MGIKAMTRNEVFDGGLGGDAEIIDLYTNNKFTIRISVSKSYHHSDWQPKTLNDAEIMKSILGKWSWSQAGGKASGVRPSVMGWAKNRQAYETACSVHLMPHDKPLYGQYAYNIGSNASLRQGGQADYGHLCCHYIDSLPNETFVYTVKAGDTLSMIASTINVNIAYIAQVNNIENVNKIYAGQKLTIPIK